jgi:crotonobetainyl-CoA:carnitine CoA-transferase CaiB-like acyl-CoA transferase
MRGQPLEGVRVVDLTTGIAGGYATKLLADAGAEVWKIEAPEGDDLRAWSASGRSFDAAGDGVLFRYLHTSKRAAALDLESAAGRNAVLGLYAGAALVLEGFAPGRIDALGLGWEALSRGNPRASLLQLSPFGQRSPWSQRLSNDFTLQAWSGSTRGRGRDGMPPLAVGCELSEWMSGTYLAVGALAALRRADLCGRGDALDVSKLEAIAPTFGNCGTLWGHFSGIWDLPMSEDVPSIEPTRDGWVGFCIFTPQQWKDFSLLIERPDLGSDPTLCHMMARHARRDEIRKIVREVTRQKTTAEVLELCEALRVPAAPIGNGETLPAIDHFAERGSFVANPRGGFTQPRIPYESSAWPRRAFAPAPTLAEARAAGAEAVRGAGLAWQSEPHAVEPGAQAGDAAPLAGLRVLDLTAFWAGPYGCFALACLGADVIHVESIQRPDGMRFGTSVTPQTDRWWEYGPTFHASNTGKRGITLDLTRPEGVDLLLQLVAKSDVLVENYSPRVLGNFGLGWERFQQANPRLTLVRMPAFGLGGPWRDRVGFAQTMEQVSGIAWLTSYPESAGEAAGPLTPRAASDPLAGLHAAFAALLAVRHRIRSGRGCQIESIMVETSLAVAAEQVCEYSATGELLHGDANRGPRAAPQGLYRCEGVGLDGGPLWLAISVRSDAQWQALARAIGREAWSRATRFASLAARRAAHDEIDAAIEAWSRGRAVREAAELLLAAGVPAAEAIGTRRPHELEPLAKSDFFETVEHALHGGLPVAAMPLRFGHRPARWFERAAPMLGEHNAEVLGGLLGLDAERLAELEREGILGTRPRGL